MVNVQNSNGDLVACRLILDTGSELSYVSECCIHALGLARTPSRILVTGISSIKADTTRGCSTLRIQSRISEDQLVAQAHVLGKITSSLERQSIDASALQIFNELADSQFSTSGPIDIHRYSAHIHINRYFINFLMGYHITVFTMGKQHYGPHNDNRH
ncbi:hypothetical protein KR074_007110 [Drosophila pseudoananassae]|nr:hypothetical protein KR074_007110 [Drosophila pseudoananassae]